ncbi:hypothetical protein AKJ09_06007 [Labilithrix luteola]|uniref:Uncharacterized protein n=1 Tax=Labilithrix luteola TaxID=1391654 RepID=A0A0K1Q0N8_9BACT|nr:hypothetical protein AKJ09_06007 [Labilithrix luteola]
MTPTDVFAAAQARDARHRQGAEALIAGFDRPGRSPRRARASRDFVDYYASSKNSEPFVPRRNTEDEINSAVERVEGLAPRKGLPSWAPLVIVTVTACILVAGVAYIATSDDPPPRTSSSTASAAVSTAATTLTAASGSGASTRSARPPDDIPPPATPDTVILPATAAPDLDAPALHKVTPSASMSGRPRAPEPPPSPQPAQGSHPATTNPTPPATAAPPSSTPPRDDFIRAL